MGVARGVKLGELPRAERAEEGAPARQRRSYLVPRGTVARPKAPY